MAEINVQTIPNYLELKKQYAIECETFLALNKDKICEAFIEYFGEEYRDRIEYRFNYTFFSFYFLFPKIKEVFEVGQKQELPPKIVDKYQTLLSSYEAYPKPEDQTVPDYFVYISDENLLVEEKYRERVLTQIAVHHNPTCVANIAYNHVYNFIAFPLLACNFHAFIHELSHAVTTEMMAIIENEGEYTPLISNGVYYTTVQMGKSDDLIVEELLNDIGTSKIKELATKRGISKSMIFNNIISLGFEYSGNLYLVMDFYNAFEPLIKKSRIENSRNLLLNGVGEDNYNEFVSLVNKYYVHDDVPTEEHKIEAMKEISPVIDKMIKYYNDNNIDEVLGRSI